MKVRKELPSDYDSIRRINIDAFKDEPLSCQTEHLIIEELRKAGAMSLSLVAEDDAGNVCAHIAFSDATLDGEPCNCFLVGPLAVAPKMQGRGIGTALIKAALEEVRKMGISACILIGDPAFYTRFGFVGYERITMQGVPQENVMIKIFDESFDASGNLGHHSAFLVKA